jgi:hypothetical protein
MLLRGKRRITRGDRNAIFLGEKQSAIFHVWIPSSAMGGVESLLSVSPDADSIYIYEEIK